MRVPLEYKPVLANGGTNGHTTNGSKGTNGLSSPTTSLSSPRGLKGHASGLSVGGKRLSSANYSSIGERFHGSQKLPVVEDNALVLKRKSMSELGAGVYQSVENTSFIDLVEWIRQERITTLPHKGSTWDTVLIRALNFAEHLNNFERVVQELASGSDAAGQLGYGHVRLLLQLGHENSQALDKACAFLYKCSLMVSTLLDRREFLQVTSEVKEQLCMLYTDLLMLVVEVAIRFYKTVHGMTAGSVSLDLYELLGDSIEGFRARRSKISDAIWSYKIGSEQSVEAEEILSIEVLSKWLGPQDRVLSMLGTDHTIFAESQAEFTCLWFQDELIKFIKGSDECLLLNADPGCGKTTLAAWITNRLQRPVARKSYSTLFCAIGSGVTQANTIDVVKTLLYQLLYIRIGNLRLYRELVRAYEHARQTADPKAYEEHLWTALDEILQHPLEHANDTVMIIDGLDDIHGGQPAAQALFDRLTQIVSQAKGTKLVTMATSLAIPATVGGLQRTIKPEDTGDDMHAVATRFLAHCRHFTSKPGREQENILHTIRDTAKGNFLWTSLFCEFLKTQKTPEKFTSELQEPKNTSIPNLIPKLVTALQLSNDAALLLSWLTTAARPLTYDELENLFAIDVEKSTRSDKRTNVHHLVQSIKPLVSVHSDVVRVRHGAVQKTLQTLFDQGRIPVPVKDRQMDMLLRMLTYTKVTLHDKGEPTLDLDQALPVRLFPRHHLLEYAIRYWPHHLKQTKVILSGSNEPKVSAELHKAFPESTTMPILEWICWDDQFPGAQEVELHVLVGRVRKTIFGENHPTVLQSYINTATYYEPIGDDREACKYYYWASIIGQAVLNPFHPITVECGSRFLTITESMTTTSRTEIMTQRERVLVILITAYERQFGATSELVIETRQLLVQLYQMIHEEDRATEIIRIIHGATVEKHGKDSAVARDMSDHLRVQFGKNHKGKEDKPHKTIFGDESEDEDEGTVIVFDLHRITILLLEASTYVSEKRFLEAEQIYVELWQKLTERCRTTLSLEWHELKIDTVNTYAKFLKTQKRVTETSAILICVAQEYEHHELSYSENIISRLIESAKTLKSVGHYTAALSIFRQASSYYKSTRKEQSSTFTEIEEEIVITSSEILKHATSGSTATEKTSTTSESSMAKVFHAMITNTTIVVDKATLTLAKQLVIQYTEQRKWSEAVSVIHSTLERTWTSFFAASLHSVSMTSTFLQESVELVERLAECYLQQRLFERVIDVYTRLFKASLTSPKQHKDLLDKSTVLLITFYDKHGYPDKAIGIYQELLAVYRHIHGPSHDLTVHVLYQLGSRCHTHARTHPYWTEYYQQITVVLNKDTEVHAGAMEATIIVANSYWEERRYTDAIAIFTVLWNTFVSKTQQHKHFKDVTFVQNLFDHYYQCLEATSAEWETLYRVTKQYRETCVKTFGASSAITISATLTLARVTQSSEKHTDEAISWFEEVSKTSSASSSTSSSSSKEESSLVRQTLATLYKRRITTQTSVSSETLERATSIYQEQLIESTSQYGYAHSSTLSSLHEVVTLLLRQSKTEVAIKEIHTAVVEIITKETSEEKMLDCATSIAQTMQSCKQVQQCTELIQELHCQLIAKERRKSSKFSFDLTSCSSSSLVFLAGLEYNIRTDLSLTLSYFLSDIIAEQIYYEQFRRVMKARSGLDKILIAGAPLRYFLLHRHRADLARSVEDQIVQLFIQRDTADLKLLSKDSPRIFIIGILEHLGNRKTTNFVRAVILASNRSLAALIEDNKFAEAYDVANVAFVYAQYHKGYHGPSSIGRGFELASYLDGRGENRCPEEGLRKKLLQLSNSIIKEILKICHDQKINMAQVQITELNDLIALLGEQRDYETLESLLATLWSTRDEQRSWTQAVRLNIGQRLICARYLANHHTKAIRLSEDVAYNLRRVHGARHPATLEAYALLAQLYTSAGQEHQKSAEKDKSAAFIAADHFKKAIFVHENILRWLIAGESDGPAEDEDDEDTAAMILKEHGVVIDEDNDGMADEDEVDRGELAKQTLHLLKLAFQRLGSWPKQYAVYENLNSAVFRVFGSELKGVEGVEKWQAKGFGAGKAESDEGVFVGVNDWDILPIFLEEGQVLDRDDEDEL